MQFMVLENTPGYMPEDDDPFVGTFGDALEVAVERVIEIRDDEMHPRDIIYTNMEPNHFATFHLVALDVYDLGRIVEVVPIEEW